jgi:hypothetical protein
VILSANVGNQGSTFGSPAAADVDFDGALEIAIGAQDGSYKALAFELSGLRAAGWEQGRDLAYGDAQNAPAVCDSNADGTVDLNFVDSSCLWRMFDGVGNTLQEGVTGSPDIDVYSSPAIGDLGPPKTEVDTDGFEPDAPTRGVPGLVVGSRFAAEDRMQVWAFSTILSDPGYTNEMGIPGWWIAGWPKGRDNAGFWYHRYDSSPAIADIDGDWKLDVVIGCEHRFEPPGRGSDGPVDVFCRGEYTLPTYEYDRAGWNMPVSEFGWFSSPAIAPLRSLNSRDIVIAGDDGRVYALYAQQGQAQLLPITGWEGGIDVTATAGKAISTSPSVADIDGDGYLEVVVGADDGCVYVLDQRGRNTPWSPQRNRVYMGLQRTGGRGAPSLLLPNDRGREQRRRCGGVRREREGPLQAPASRQPPMESSEGPLADVQKGHRQDRLLRVHVPLPSNQGLDSGHCHIQRAASARHGGPRCRAWEPAGRAVRHNGLEREVHPGHLDARRLDG